jgi:hypothetical protein
LKIVDDPCLTADRLNHDLECIKAWTKDWLVTINPDKTKSMIFSLKRLRPNHPPLFFNNNEIQEVFNHKHLGVTLLSNLTWTAHIINIHEKASKRLNLLKGLKFKLNRKTLSNLYKCLIRQLLKYADVLWDGCSDNESYLIEHVQYHSAMVVSGAIRGICRSRVLEDLAWEDMKTRRLVHKLILYFEIVNNHVPEYLSNLLPQTVEQRSGLSLRQSFNISLFFVRTERFKKSFFPSATMLWNTRSTQFVACHLIIYSKKLFLIFFIFHVSVIIATILIIPLINILQYCMHVYV